MKTNKYWQQRFIQLTDSLLNKGEQYYDDLIKEYEKAIQSLERDIIMFYERFAENNEVTLVEAKRMLSAKELKEFYWTVEEYVQKGRENAIDQRWMKELENASIRVRMSRLEALQVQMRQHVETISAKRLAGMTKLATEIMEDGYYRTIFEVQKGLGMGNTFSKLDIKTIEATISKPWAPDGSNFSSRIWRDREVLMSELQKELAQSFIRGDAPDEAIRNIAKKMDVSKKAAGRLVMTEAAYFAGETRARAFKELGVEEYQFIATLDDRTSDICQEMDLKVFKLSDRAIGVNWPPLHCWCRSTVAPYFDDNTTKRFARDPATGARYYVPGDMTYKEWYNKYVKPNTEPTGIGDWTKDENGIIIPTEIVADRYSPKMKGKPDSVIQYYTRNGKQVNRDFYDSNGWLAKQINVGDHGNRKSHPFGNKGEHMHFWKYENGKIVDRKAVEIPKHEILENKDILEV